MHCNNCTLYPTGMADRIVYLRDLINAKMTTGEGTSEHEDENEYNLGANGSIPSFDSPSMIMYTSGKSPVLFKVFGLYMLSQ